MNKDELVKHFLEESDDLFMVVDESLSIRYVTTSVSILLGIDPFLFLGAKLTQLFPAPTIAKWQSAINANDSGTYHDEVELADKSNQTRHFEIAISVHHQPERHLVFLKLHDITARKEREIHLAKTNAQLDQIIYKTTHDLKAPLNSALGLVSLAERASADDHSRYISMIKGSLLKLDAFLREMTDFFKDGKMGVRCDEVDVADLVEGELQCLDSSIKSADITVNVQVEAAYPLRSDALRLKTVIGNLLSNAVKYADPNKRERVVEVSVSVSQEQCLIIITDNGIGIDKTLQPRIFDLFFRATSYSEGTGLGLFIVKDTIEKLNGEIRVESEPGHGASFIISIPNQILQSARVA